MVNFTVGGFLFSFGIYQEHYSSLANTADSPFSGVDPANIDLIGSLALSLMTLLSPFAVAWAKQFHPRYVICTGGVVFGLGHILASFSRELWHFQLSQGLMVGIGSCLSLVPSMTSAITWFDKHRAFAVGVVSAGTGVGGLVFTPLTSIWLRSLGYPDALRITGAISAFLLCASGLVLHWSPEMQARLRADRKQLSWVQALYKIPMPAMTTAKTAKFITHALGAGFQSAAYYTPGIFFASFAKTIGYSAADGANLTAAANACNAIGKIGIGIVADRVGRLNSFAAVSLVTAALSFALWLPSELVGGLNPSAARGLFVTFTIAYGIFASAYVSLFPAALIELFGLDLLPNVTGVMYMIQGIGTLVGTPVAGVLVRHSDGSDAHHPRDFTYMTVFVGVLMSVASAMACWVRLEAHKQSQTCSHICVMEETSSDAPA